MRAQLTLGAVVGLILLLLVLMALHDWTFNGEARQQALKTAPIITSQGVTGKVFDESGELKYRLTAERARQYDYSQRLQLQQPQMTIFNDNGHWLVSAEQGSMRQGEKLSRSIVLEGDVEADHVGQQAVSISSAKIQYWPDEQKLVSPGEVLIRQQENTTRAGHLQADMVSGRLLLSEGVESHYVPAS